MSEVRAAERRTRGIDSARPYRGSPYVLLMVRPSLTLIGSNVFYRTASTSAAGTSVAAVPVSSKSRLNRGFHLEKAPAKQGLPEHERQHHAIVGPTSLTRCKHGGTL